MSFNSYSHKVLETYRQVLDETNERSTFDLHCLPRVIVKCQHEVKKVALTKIRWWLLFEMCSGQTTTTARKMFGKCAVKN